MTTIGGKPLEPDKVYKVAVLFLVAAKGIDGVTPLADYVAAHARDEDMHTDEEAAHGAKEVTSDCVIIVHQYTFAYSFSR